MPVTGFAGCSAIVDADDANDHAEEVESSKARREAVVGAEREMAAVRAHVRVIGANARRHCYPVVKVSLVSRATASSESQM